MNLHRVLTFYYGFLIRIFIIRVESIKFPNENSTQIEFEKNSFIIENKENYSFHSFEQQSTLPVACQLEKEKLNFLDNYNISSTKNFRQNHIWDVLLKRRKRFIIFPQDTSIKCTLTVSKAMLNNVPRGLALFWEWDGYYPVPDTLEKWKPTHRPDDPHHAVTINKDPKPPPIPPSIPTDDDTKNNDDDMSDHDNDIININNDHHNDTYNFHYDDHLKDDSNKFWPSESFPYLPNEGSEKIYPTPPPGWNNDDNNNIKTIDSSENNDDNDDSSDNKDSQSENYKKYDSWNKWNRKYNSVPVNIYNKYQDYSKYTRNKYQPPIQNRYHKEYQNNFPIRWNQYQKQPYYINWKQAIMSPKNNQTFNRRRNHSNDWYERYSHHGHKIRRQIYNEIERYGLLFGFPNIKHCIFRTICEVRNYLLPRGVSLLHDIIRVIFTLPYKQNWSDDFTNEVRSEKKNCRLAFEKTCPFSLLEYILFSNQNNINHNFEIS